MTEGVDPLLSYTSLGEPQIQHSFPRGHTLFGTNYWSVRAKYEDGSVDSLSTPSSANIYMRDIGSRDYYGHAKSPEETARQRTNGLWLLPLCETI